VDGVHVRAVLQAVAEGSVVAALTHPAREAQPRHHGEPVKAAPASVIIYLFKYKLIDLYKYLYIF
jgi:hypothetical protein